MKLLTLASILMVLFYSTYEIFTGHMNAVNFGMFVYSTCLLILYTKGLLPFDEGK